MMPKNFKLNAHISVMCKWRKIKGLGLNIKYLGGKFKNSSELYNIIIVNKMNNAVDVFASNRQADIIKI